MTYDQKLWDWCIKHKREVESYEEHSPSFMYEVMRQHDWRLNALFKWEGMLVVFSPGRCSIEQYLERDYVLGVFYYGSYYSLLPEHVTSANLGNALVFSDDYLRYTYLPDDYIPYHLF